MLSVNEIELKLRNKQHHLEGLAEKLSKSLKDNILGPDRSERQAYAQQELQQVRHAILRIKQGTYSECELCHHSIEAARLLALPYTALCSACASEH